MALPPRRPKKRTPTTPVPNRRAPVKKPVKRKPVVTGSFDSAKRPRSRPAPPPTMEDQANTLAMGQIAPQLANIGEERAREAGANTTRKADITGWANWQQGNLNSAFDATKGALDKYLSLQSSNQVGNQEAMSAALRAASGSNDQLAGRLGGPAGETGVGNAVQHMGENAAQEQGLAGANAATQIAGLGQARDLASVGLGQNQETERQRYNAIQNDLTGKTTDLYAQVPGLQQSNLKDLRESSRQSANDQFQQAIAMKELDLKASDLDFTHGIASRDANRADQTAALDRSKFAHESAIDWANVGINRKQAEAQLAALHADVSKAKTQAAKDKAIARGTAYAKGITMLSGFLAPQKGEATGGSSSRFPYSKGVANEDDPTKTTVTYKRTFDAAFRKLQSVTSRADALRILSQSDFADWRTKARIELARLRKRGVQAYSKGSGKPD